MSRRSSPHIAIIKEASPQNQELFAFRRILLHKPVRSFEDAKFGHATYFQAARSLGLLRGADDCIWATVLEEYAQTMMPPEELQKIFVLILLHGITSVQDIWDDHWDKMSRTRFRNVASKLQLLTDLDAALIREGKRILQFEERLPFVNQYRHLLPTNDSVAHNFFARAQGPFRGVDLNQQQNTVYAHILHGIRQEQKLFYINGSAGTGKTHLMCGKTHLMYFRVA